VRVAAIILNYHGRADTALCVASIADQGLSAILVIDNSESVDEESSLRESLGPFSRVRLESNGRNLGFAGGVNYGLRCLGITNYDAFLLLNNDTLAPPNSIGRLIDGVESACVDLAAPVIRCYPETNRIWSEGNYYNRPTGMTGPRTPRRFPGDFDYLTGCCLLVRREVFETVGLLDESFFMYGEDIEFCFRAARRGFRLGVVRDAVIYHKVSASAVPNSDFYEYSLNLGHFLLSDRLARGPTEKVFHVALKTWCLGLRALLRTLRYVNWNAVRGYLGALRTFVMTRSHPHRDLRPDPRQR